MCLWFPSKLILPWILWNLYLQNDHVITECTYNSTMRPGFTRGGFTAQNEMCLLFLHYYPATRLAHCASRLSFKHVLLALGVNVWPLTRTTRHLGLRIKDPWQYQNLTFSDYLRVAATKDTAVSLKLQEASLHHSHKAECYDYGRRKIYAVSWANKMKIVMIQIDNKLALQNVLFLNVSFKLLRLNFRMESNFLLLVSALQSMKFPTVVMGTMKITQLIYQQEQTSRLEMLMLQLPTINPHLSCLSITSFLTYL